MILYGCSSTSVNLDSLVGKVETNAKMGCTDIAFAWAVGGKDFCFPPNIGVDMNGYYLMEIHYDNPKKATGLVDSSGFRIHYIPATNADFATFTAAGTIIVGAPLHFSIPAGRKEYTLAATQKVKTNNKVKVFATMVHGHKIARKIWTTHSVTGQDIACDTEYSFDLQEFEPRPVHFDLGHLDEVKTTCTYDSTNKTVTTTAGEDSDAEMCLTALMYYPKVGTVPSLQMATVAVPLDGAQTKTCVRPTGTSAPTPVAGPALLPCDMTKLIAVVNQYPASKDSCTAWNSGKAEQTCPCLKQIPSSVSSQLKCLLPGGQNLFAVWEGCNPPPTPAPTKAVSSTGSAISPLSSLFLFASVTLSCLAVAV